MPHLTDDVKLEGYNDLIDAPARTDRAVTSHYFSDAGAALTHCWLVDQSNDIGFTADDLAVGPAPPPPPSLRCRPPPHSNRLR